MSGVHMVADLMEIAAVTAPKTRGQDYVVVTTLTGEQVVQLAAGMKQHGERKDIPGFIRDGENISHSEAVVLVGIKDALVADLNCGACGEDACLLINTHEGEFKGPQCALRILDLGIALGSAVKTAGMMNVDNRIMYRAGVVARELGLIDADLVMGIPLSVSGKNIYFDR